MHQNKLRLALLGILILTLLACNTLAKAEPPGVGEKAELGYAICDPIIAALEQYQVDAGMYPESLSELVPGYIASAPTEVNDEPLTYSKTDEGYSLQFHYLGPGTNTCTYTPKDGWHCSGAY
jgi:hypothetical protein